MLKGLELKRDMESILCGTNQAKNAGAAATARVTASVLSWIKTTRPRARPRRIRQRRDGTGTRTDGTHGCLPRGDLKTGTAVCLNTGGKPDVS